MKKSIICLITVLIFILSVPFANVSAAGIVYKEDFENPPATGLVTDMEGWKAYDSARTAGASFENGAVKLARIDGEANSASGYALYDISYGVGSTSDHIVMFDIKMINNVFDISGWFYMGTSRVGMPTSLDDGMEADKWYTVVFQATNSSGGVQTANFYRKGPWSNESEKASCQFAHITTIDGSAHTSPAHINIGSQKAAVGSGILIDNFEVAEKDFISDVVFKADGAVIDKAEDVNGATTLMAEATIFSGTNMTPQLNGEQSIMPMLLVFDSDGQMLDCKITVESIGALYNTITSSLDVSSWSDKVDKIQYYVWDSIDELQPLFDSVDVN